MRRDVLYGSRWRRLRRQYLDAHPLCVFCEHEGIARAAVELDHIKRHKGDAEVFFDEANLQGLCRYHHRTTKAQMERSGTIKGCDPAGTPLDPNHHWLRLKR